MHGFCCPAACGIPVPWPGTQLVSRTLQGKFLTTGASGKSLCFWSCLVCFFWNFVPKGNGCQLSGLHVYFPMSSFFALSLKYAGASPDNKFTPMLLFSLAGTFCFPLCRADVFKVQSIVPPPPPSPPTHHEIWFLPRHDYKKTLLLKVTRERKLLFFAWCTRSAPVLTIWAWFPISSFSGLWFLILLSLCLWSI